MSIENSKQIVRQFRAALYDTSSTDLAAALSPIVTSDCDVRLPYPLGDVSGFDGLIEAGFGPLMAAIPDLERRDYIAVGADDRDEQWIACGGYYCGVLERSWLDIPATRHYVHMRYIEFFRVADAKINKMRLLWDIPSLMLQADAWPLAPSLGVEILVPGPATADGIIDVTSDPAHSQRSLKLVSDMLAGLRRFASDGASGMHLDRYWHSKMNWYGPAGIGSNRRLSGFRNWHQIPFLSGMPDRQSNENTGEHDCFFADGDYVAFCGWPAMTATVSGDGWLGISPAGQALEFASLDIWRCESGLIRENWVMIDMLDVWRQLGVNVFDRMRETTFSRQTIPFKE